MLNEVVYLNEVEEVQLSFNPWDNSFKALAESLGAYHESCIIGRYKLEVNLYDDGDVQIYAYHIRKWLRRPLKFYIRSCGGKTTIHLGKLDGEGANLLHRLIKAFNL